MVFPALILVDGVILSLIWKLWKRLVGWYVPVCAVLALLLGLSIWATDTHIVTETTPVWLASLLVYGVYMLLPSAAVVVAARLIDVHQPGGQSLNWRRLIPGLLLAGVLLLLVSYQLTLASIWDVATDGLRGLFLAQIVGGTALVAAVLLAWSLPGRWKLMALAFAVIVPFWMNTARTLGTYDPDGKWGKLPTLLTEQRAQTITDALQRYHDHTGRYPESLSELAPWYLVSVPTPYIIPGQPWCYSGGSNYYRLGYASRQSFSSPIAARLYAGVGQPPDPAWHCP